MRQILSEKEIGLELKTLPEWSVKEGKLYARFEFLNFKVAMAFMTIVAIEAEKLNHHPEWSNVWNTVEISLSTHDAGDKITDLDLELAKAISNTAKTLSAKA